ncbi:plexin-D1 isoform X2 [Protopterus annectens]|uniref:plexin-D1 isoform X2 n=1 Tax=Protopterus annectens TaxID=7888 RepID=UPI001CFC3A86|nr:plexin-D1 isoform X2 [Protopterus annectens]
MSLGSSAAPSSVILVLILVKCTSGLEVRHKFTSPSLTNNFVIDRDHGKVYVAAVNQLYQLRSLDLHLEAEDKNGPVMDSFICHAPQLKAKCEHPLNLTDNYNKMLLLDSDQGILVVCGSVYQGFCELRRRDNISVIALPFPENSSLATDRIFPSLLTVAANSPDASTVGLVLKPSQGDTKLLVGATYTGMGSRFFPKNLNKLDLRFENTPEIAVRSLNLSEPSRLFTYSINPSEDNVFKIKQEAKSKNLLSFVRAFNHNNFSYIAFNNDATLGDKESHPNSILARICLEPQLFKGVGHWEAKKLTESYIQMGLQCGADKDVYNRLLSVSEVQRQGSKERGTSDLLFGVFEKSTRVSAALCVFHFPDIENKIRHARNSCFSINSNSKEEVTVMEEAIQGSGPSCKPGNMVLRQEQLDCGAAHLHHPLAIKGPLKARPLFQYQWLTSVVASSVNDHVVVFLGTANGQLLKLTFDNNLTFLSQQNISAAFRESVHHTMALDPKDNRYLFLMTFYQMMLVKVDNCDAYTTCEDCLRAADAYCGWCTLESRCSSKQECTDANKRMYWTGLSQGKQKCPSMNITQSHINKAETITMIVITLLGNIPNLTDMNVSCKYGTVTKKAANHSQELVTCPFLPRHKYPDFPHKQAYVELPITLEVNGTSIVKDVIIIYDCERNGLVNPKSSCTSCLETKWKCNWCNSLHSCVSNTTDCKDILQNSTQCLQVVNSHVEPRTTGISQSITVTLTGTTASQGALECVFGEDKVFEARWENSSTVVCKDVQLSTIDRQRSFSLNLRLNSSGKFIDNPEDLKVEVYNCSVGSLDCSQCLGRADQGHRCSWLEGSCKQQNKLGVSDDSCPAPEIQKISPSTGPLEGGTLLTIKGRNLGRRISDIIDAVRIGEVKCSVLPKQYIVSAQIVCRTGKAEIEFSDRVIVNNSKEGISEEEFSYRKPLVTSIEPDSGPKAGGTKVTIFGSNLHIGSEIQVLVNGTKKCALIMHSSDTIKCTMPSMQITGSGNVSICVQFEGNPCINSSKFTYKENPVINDIRPKKSHISGGRIITVEGKQFELVQQVSMVVQNFGKEITNCMVQSNTQITCPSPAASDVTAHEPAVVDFYINGVLYEADTSFDQRPVVYRKDAYTYKTFGLEYHHDPQFFAAKKEKWIKHYRGDPLALLIHKEPDDLELSQEEYKVKTGPFPCQIVIVKDKEIHCTVNDSLNTDQSQLPVIVHVGKFNQTIATVHFGGSETAIIVSIVICSILLLLSVVALFVFCTKSQRAERHWKKTLLQMDEMESQIREEIRKGFAELQTDMTDLTKELNRSQGIPFLEYKDFVTRTFFPTTSCEIQARCMQPVYENCAPKMYPNKECQPLLLNEWKIPENGRSNVEEGITLFSTLLSNKHFLITFVHALEQQKDFAVRDRCNLASLLTIALHGKLEYYTSIMKDLLVDLIDASASKNPKLMLRRTESVVEKMLTNWMSICMYSYLKETVGEPFFLLLCAIKQQINKGSIDAITGKARYTLNEEWLLRENIEAKPVNLNVSFQGCGMDSLTVRVMDTDTIYQVKEKILEAFYKNTPFSQRPKVEDVDLEWFASGNDNRILRDLDNTSVLEDGRKKLNTALHYKIPDGASLAMSLKDKRDNTLGRVKDLDTEKYFHLVIPTDDLAETKKPLRQSQRKKVLPEIYLTRLLSTKGTLQKFLDDLFKAILGVPPENPPVAIKYFFDFLEEQAEKRGITDPDTLHIWKTNSLLLRFWVNILKNPQFVFDIDKSDHMDACLSVIAQAFIDACSLSDLQLGKDSPTNKLLYAKEIPEYKKAVQTFYKQIQEMTPLSEQEMNAHLAEDSWKYRNEFNTNFAITETYKYAKKYRSQIGNALEANATTKRTQLQHKFEQVFALMEDNIYECCSEA